jgi:hypothetical protein
VFGSVYIKIKHKGGRSVRTMSRVTVRKKDAYAVGLTANDYVLVALGLTPERQPVALLACPAGTVACLQQDSIVCLPLLWITSSSTLNDEERYQQALKLHEANDGLHYVQDLFKERQAAKDRAKAAPWEVSDDETEDTKDGSVQDMTADGVDAVSALESNANLGTRSHRAKRTRDVAAATDYSDDLDSGRAPKRPKKRGGRRKAAAASSAVDNDVSSAAGKNNSTLSNADQVPTFSNSTFPKRRLCLLSGGRCACKWQCHQQCWTRLSSTQTAAERVRNSGCNSRSSKRH